MWYLINAGELKKTRLRQEGIIATQDTQKKSQ